MSELGLGAGPFFQRGIERIVDAPRAPEELLLPDAPALAPAELPSGAALQVLLQADNLEAMLALWVAPELVERELLAPRRFRAAMESVLARLRRLSQAGGAADAHAAELMEQAAGVLANELAMRDLLNLYRNALLQG